MIFRCFSLLEAYSEKKNTLALDVSRSLLVLIVTCISSVAWRFGGPIVAKWAEATPELEIEAYPGLCQ